MSLVSFHKYASAQRLPKIDPGGSVSLGVKMGDRFQENQNQPRSLPKQSRALTEMGGIRGRGLSLLGGPLSGPDGRRGTLRWPGALSPAGSQEPRYSPLVPCYQRPPIPVPARCRCSPRPSPLFLLPSPRTIYFSLRTSPHPRRPRSPAQGTLPSPKPRGPQGSIRPRHLTGAPHVALPTQPITGALHFSVTWPSLHPTAPREGTEATHMRFEAKGTL